MSESQLADELQQTANIDKIKHVWRKVKLRERQEAIRERAEDAEELNFDECGIDGRAS